MFSWRQSTGAQCTDQGPAFEHTLAQAKKGDAEGITALYRHFLPGIFGYIAARVPNRSIAEDLTSEVFLKMVEGIARVRTHEEAGIAAWLLQVARFTVAGYYRQQEKQPDCVSLEPANEEGDGDTWGSAVVLVNHPDTDPVLRSESREEWNTVVHAMKSLTEEQRQVLVGRLILGYDVATVARMIGKQANAVKALQFRALQSLNRILKKNMQPDREQTGMEASPIPTAPVRVPTRGRRYREDAR
jgi:RNA polymerase sigma-70 factor (ECF subfamily)